MGVSIVPCYKRVFRVLLLPVGRITHQAIQKSKVPGLPAHTTASPERQTSGDTNPKPETHAAATAALSPSIEAEHRVQSPDDTEPSGPSPTAVRCLFYLGPY